MGLYGFIFHQETTLKYHSHIGGGLFKLWENGLQQAFMTNYLIFLNVWAILTGKEITATLCTPVYITSVHTLQKCIPLGKLTKRETIKSSDGA